MIVALTPTVTSLLFVLDMHTRRKSFGVAEHVLTPPHASFTRNSYGSIIKIKETASRKTDGHNAQLYTLKTRFPSLVSRYILSSFYLLFFGIHFDRTKSYASTYVNGNKILFDY